MSVPGGQQGAPADTERPCPAPDHLVAAVLADPRSGVAVGTFGAIAEFLRPDGATREHEHAGRTHIVRTDGGAARITVTDDVLTRAWRRPTGAGTGWSHAVALCLPAERAAGPARAALTELGPDDGALLDAPDGAVLVDLGLGVAHLEACVRTADADLLARLRAAAGRPLDAELASALVEAGPTRVFRTALARVEVATPIPPPTGQSPAGPHTHLLPALLAHRRPHAATDPVPDGHVAVATLFPPHPTHDALGREHPVDDDADAAFAAVLEVAGEADEVAWGRHVHDRVGAGAPAEAPPADLSRAGRRGWETALRRRRVLDGPSATLAAWRERTRGATDDDVPFHEAH
jgi:hypothetical protein